MEQKEKEELQKALYGKEKSMIRLERELRLFEKIFVWVKYK